MDMCNGPILKNIILFSIPLILSNILQMLFNAADMIVVGKFVGPHALAAVGATSSLINLFLNLFIGFSVGVNVTVARLFGSNNKFNISEAVHTSIMLSIIFGFALMIAGIFLAKPLLLLTGAPADVIDQSTLYMKIYFAGMPVTTLYNFGAAILRAVGDTRRPLYFLACAGALNVIMNIIFITQFGMGVEGVALATVLSQVVSAILLIIALTKTNGAYKLELKKLKLHKMKLIQIAKVGIPAGIQGMTFSVSNVLIQSSINSFGTIAVAGSTAASNIENFTYMAMNAIAQASLSFTGQNYGAQKTDRIKRSLLLCVICVAVVGSVLGIGSYLFGNTLLGIYSNDTEVTKYGLIRLSIISSTYALCGVMDVLVGALRGLGYSFVPMLVSIGGACGLRILWIFTIFQKYKTLPVLYVSYPITWTITAICHLVCFFVIYKKIKAKMNII